MRSSGLRSLILGSSALIACSVSAMATSVNYDLATNPTTTNNPNIQNAGSTNATTGLAGVNYGASPYLLPIYGVTTSTAPNLNVFNASTQSWGSGTWSPGSIGTTNLYGKNQGGGETGLGIMADPASGEHEEFSNNGHYGFLVLSVANLKNINGLTYLQLQIGSAQSGELFTIWGSSSATCSGAGSTGAGCTSLGSATLLMSGPGGSGAVAGPFDVPNWANYNYIWVGAEVNPNTNANGQSNILLDANISFTDTRIAGGTPEPATLALAGSSLIGLAFYLRRWRAKR